MSTNSQLEQIRAAQLRAGKYDQEIDLMLSDFQNNPDKIPSTTNWTFPKLEPAKLMQYRLKSIGIQAMVYSVKDDSDGEIFWCVEIDVTAMLKVDLPSKLEN